jgi:hypothetical protein
LGKHRIAGIFSTPGQRKQPLLVGISWVSTKNYGHLFYAWPERTAESSMAISWVSTIITVIYAMPGQRGKLNHCWASHGYAQDYSHLLYVLGREDG